MPDFLLCWEWRGCLGLSFTETWLGYTKLPPPLKKPFSGSLWDSGQQNELSKADRQRIIRLPLSGGDLGFDGGCKADAGIPGSQIPRKTLNLNSRKRRNFRIGRLRPAVAAVGQWAV